MRNLRIRIGSSLGIVAVAVLVLVLAAIPSTALAADGTWNGSSSAVWATAGNWTGGVPGTGNIATFNAGSTNTIVDLGAGVTVKTIFFDTALAAPYTIGTGGAGSQTLTLDSAGVVTMNPTVANNQLFNANMVLGTGNGNQAFTFTNNSLANSLTFAGGISSTTTGTKTLTVTGWGGNTSISGALTNGSGTLAMTKAGAGTLTLSGLNTYTGVTTVNDGTLLLDMNAGGSLSSSSGLTLGGGGTFSVLGKGSGTTDLSMGALKLADHGGIGKIVLNPSTGAGTTLTLASLADRYFGASLLIDYSVNPGTQAVVLTNDDNYPLRGGPTGIYMDYLVKDSAGVTGFATREAVTNKIIRYDDTTGDVLTTISNNANKNFSTSNSTWTAGTISWTGVADRSVTSLTIDTTNSGGIATIDMGAATNTLNPLSTDSELAILFRGPNDATLTGGRIGPNSNYMRGLIIHQVGTGTLTINSPIQTGWNTDLTKDGEGTLVLGGTFVTDPNPALSTTGAVVINGGTVKPGVASVPGITGPFGRNPVILADVAGATLDLDTYNTSFASLSGGGLLGGNVNLRAQALTVGDNNASATYAGVISSTASTGSLTKIGTGTQTLTGANTYTGATSVNKGTLTVSGVVGALTSTSAVTVTGNATLNEGDATLANNNDKNNRINSAATLTLGGGPVENAWGGTFSLYKPATGGTISQSLASLTVAPGASTIQNGAGTGGAATLILIGDGASVYTRNAGGTVNFATGMTSFTNIPSSNTSAGTPANPGNDPILVGAFFNNADFVKAAAGTVTAVTSYDTQNDASLWGTTAGHDGNINSGAAISGTTVGAVIINSLKNANAGSTITIGSAGTDSLSIKSGMILSTNTLTINGPGTLTSGNGQDLVVNTSSTVTVNAPISIGVLTKTGSGTLSLASSASSITGDIYPRAGTLDFNNTGSAAYSNLISGVGGISKSGADALTLSGPVTIGGAFTVNGGTANLTGPASLGGTVTVKKGGTLNWSNPYNYAGTTTGSVTLGSTTGTGPAIASISVPVGTVLTTSNQIQVGLTSAGNGGSAAGHTLSISGGTVNLLGTALKVGMAGATGTLNVSGATTSIVSTNNTGGDIGNGAGAIGYVNLSGGSLSLNSSLGTSGGSAIVYQTGGAFTNPYKIGNTGAGTTIYTMTGGTAVTGGWEIGSDATATVSVLGGTMGTGGQLYMAKVGGAGKTATLNIANGGTVQTERLSMSLAASSNSVLNLSSGGTLDVYDGIYVWDNPSPTYGTTTLNFNGGTVAYNSPCFKVGSGRWMDATNAYLFPGGVTINTKSNSDSIAQVLKTATGIGLTGITFDPETNGGTGYTAAPVVTITGGSTTSGGSTAQAVATWDQASGKVTGIVIVNPGQYEAGSPPTGVTFSNPVSGSTPDVCTTAATASIGTTADNKGGGVTKTGSGTLTLTGLNTYNGNTTVSAGTLSLANDAGLKFVIGATSGVSNRITGTGTVSLAGDFTFDLTAAAGITVGTWMIVDVDNLAETFSDTFTVADFTGGEGTGTVWTKTIGMRAWEFSEFTGELKGKLTFVPGDANRDNVVDAADYIIVKQNFGMTSGALWSDGNFTVNTVGDGTVDWADLQTLMANFGTRSVGGAPAAPEPATLGLLALGALAVIRRRVRKA